MQPDNEVSMNKTGQRLIERLNLNYVSEHNIKSCNSDLVCIIDAGRFV